MPQPTAFVSNLIFSIAKQQVCILLFVTGLAILLGGLRYQEQQFQSIVAQANASAMNLAVMAILLPTAAMLSQGVLPNPSSSFFLSSSVAVVS